MSVQIGKNIIRLASVESTNDFALTLVEKGRDDIHGTVVITEHQTNGKGQRGSKWITEHGANLTFSIILSLPVKIENHFLISKMIALALWNVLVDLGISKSDVFIKWPNDIIVNRKKIAGVLIENKFRGSKLDASIVGIGLNVNQLEFPEILKASTTSIALELKEKLEKEIVFRSLLNEINQGVYMFNHQKSIEQLEKGYFTRLFGKTFHKYQLVNEGIEETLQVLNVLPTGQIQMQNTSGKRFEFWHKEIQLLE